MVRVWHFDLLTRICKTNKNKQVCTGRGDKNSWKNYAILRNKDRRSIFQITKGHTKPRVARWCLIRGASATLILVLHTTVYCCDFCTLLSVYISFYVKTCSSFLELLCNIIRNRCNSGQFFLQESITLCLQYVMLYCSSNFCCLYIKFFCSNIIGFRITFQFFIFHYF